MVYAPPIQTKRLPTPSVSRQMPCDFVRDQGLLYDGDNVIADLTDGNMTKFYVTPFLDQNVSMTVVGGPDAGIYYYSQDGLGSVRTLTNSSGNLANHYDYDAFGVPLPTTTSESVEQRYTYTGREASGVAGGPMYYRYRTYEAELGRFGRRDPAGYTGSGCMPSLTYSARLQIPEDRHDSLYLQRINDLDFSKDSISFKNLNIIRYFNGMAGNYSALTSSLTNSDANVYVYSSSSPVIYCDPTGKYRACCVYKDRSHRTQVACFEASACLIYTISRGLAPDCWIQG